MLASLTTRYAGREETVTVSAGTYSVTGPQMLHNMTDETFELMLKVHNTAPFRLIREAAPYLRSKDPKVIATNRSIVNISSTSGTHGNTGQVNYATAKAGVLGLTKTIAKEWGESVLMTAEVMSSRIVVAQVHSASGAMRSLLAGFRPG